MHAKEILASFDSPKSLSILSYGAPALRQKGHPISQFGAELHAVYQSMLAVLHTTSNGIGLAAQQVGLALNFFVIDIDETDESCIYDGKAIPQALLMPLAFVNTTVLASSQATCTYEESCLSLPDIACPVTRPEGVTVQFQDLKGITHTLECQGLLSTCIQHEYDHTQGVLIIDYLSKLAQTKLQNKLKLLKRQNKSSKKS